jgi:hypothetical protein
MAQDDEVVGFEGARTPFVLRRIGEFGTVGSTCPVYQLVREYYLH